MLTYPLTLIPSPTALSTTGLVRENDSSTLQFKFFLLNPSLALRNTATSLTPLRSASSRPFSFGTRNGYHTPSAARQLRISSAMSPEAAICGTHFGETNAPASTFLRPALRSRRMSSSLVCEVMGLRSFCRPSRGPTSTIRTVGSRTGGAVVVVGILVANESGRRGEKGRRRGEKRGKRGRRRMEGIV